MARLRRHFFARSALQVAPELLGKILCHRENGKLTAGRIVEVEAYLGSKDPASHGYRGKTPRNEVMFGPPGYAYVYFTYGNHFCMNVVTGKKGQANAVLIRALEPMEGIPRMRRRRGKTKLEDLASGPGKLTQALRIHRKHNGIDLTKNTLWISEDPDASPFRCRASTRVGISQATKLRYRFLIDENPCVSRR